MSKYKSIGNYSSGFAVAPVRAPIMMYQSNPVHNQRAPMEVIPSYGTVGYDEPVARTYRGYYSLCGGYSDSQGIGCGLTDPSDPCFESTPQSPSGACLELLGRVLDKLNEYKMPQLLNGTVRVLDNILNTVNSFIYDEQACVNAGITGMIDTFIDNMVRNIVTQNQLRQHDLDADKRPIVTSELPLFRLTYQPQMMAVVAVPLPVNVPVAKVNKKKGRGLFGMFG